MAAVAALGADVALGGGAAKPVGVADVVAPLLSVRRAPQAVQTAIGADRLALAVDEVLGLPELAPAVGSSCVAIESGATPLVVRNPATVVTPASTLKLITGAAALARLAPERRFVTSARAGGPLVAGVLRGDLWLVGGGDPILSTDAYARTRLHQPPTVTRFEDLADAIALAGVRRVTGDVIGDERRYDARRIVSTWKRSYLTRGEVGALSALSVDDSSFVESGTETRRIADDPATSAAAVLRDLLAARGVIVDGSARPAPASGPSADSVSAMAEVARIESRPIDEIVGQMLKESDNTTAELLVKELGYEAARSGTTEAGLVVIREELARRKIPTAGLVIDDGSGLSRTDRVGCSTLVAILADDGPDGRLTRQLAVAGVSGTLTDRFRGSAAVGRLRAKTGTLNGVSGLAGVVASDRGRLVQFAFVFNGLTSNDHGMSAQEQMAEPLLRFPEAPSVAELGPPGAAPVPAATAPA